MEKKKKEFSKTRSSSSNRLSGLFRGMLGRRKQRFCVLVVDDDRKFLDDISAMLAEQPVNVEVVTAKDGLEGFAVLKERGDAVRLCLADMVMPGLSGIELMNRARSDPALDPVTFALMTEFNSQTSSRKSLSSFQVTDARGEPVSVLIKPLHSAVVADLVKRVSEKAESSSPEHPNLPRQSSDLTSERESDWQRDRTRSEGIRLVPRLDTDQATPSKDRSPTGLSPINSPGRISPGKGGGSRPGSARMSALGTAAPLDAAGVPRSTSTFEFGSNAMPASPAFPRSSSLANFKEVGAQIKGGVDSPRSRGGTPRGGTPRSRNSSPRNPSRSGSPRNFAEMEATPSPELLRRAVYSPTVGRKSQSMDSQTPVATRQSKKAEEVRARRFSKNMPEGIKDESEGVNEMMFESIPSYDRGHVPHSSSIDNLNWDEIA